MQYALTQVLPDVPAGGVCAGIDWATADHVACVAGRAGRSLGKISLPGEWPTARTYSARLISSVPCWATSVP